MPRKGHSEEQIIAALKQYESGDKVADICRKLGVSEATFYTWKKQYTGLGVQELRELPQLREENGRLKRLVADLSMDRQILQEIVKKKLEVESAVHAGAMGAANVSDRAASSGEADGSGVVHLVVSQESA